MTNELKTMFTIFTEEQKEEIRNDIRFIISSWIEDYKITKKENNNLLISLLWKMALIGDENLINEWKNFIAPIISLKYKNIEEIKKDKLNKLFKTHNWDLQIIKKYKVNDVINWKERKQVLIGHPYVKDKKVKIADWMIIKSNETPELYESVLNRLAYIDYDLYMSQLDNKY